jgi:hypothetical protein
MLRYEELSGEERMGNDIVTNEWGARVMSDLVTKKRKRMPIHIASYIGLFGTDTYRNAISGDIGTLLLAQQLPDGSFYESTHGGIPTARGVSKVLETLARIGRSRNDPAVMGARTWLESLQYHEAKPHFVPEARQAEFQWGFRDNAQSPIVRSDSVSHYLIALSLLRAP